MTESQCPPLPPFSLADAVLKVQKAEDAWNSRDPERVRNFCMAGGRLSNFCNANGPPNWIIA